MFGLGTPELIIILVIILLLFGGSQLPKLARNLGSSAKELRESLGNDGKKDAKDDDKKKTDSKESSSETPKQQG